MASVTQLKRSNPEVEGIPSSAVLEFIRAVEQHVHPMDAVQGFILLRHGNVAAEGWWTPYGPQCPHPLQSLSKSFTSTAIGLAVQEGLLTVDDAVLKFFPDDAPANPSENLKALRVRHLLSMNTGHKTDTTEHVYRHLYQISPFGPWLHQKEYTARHGPEDREDNWPKVFLSLPVEYKPGTWFVYNLPLPNGQPSSPKSNQWSGKTYKLDTNHLKLESVAITFNHERSTLSLRDERGGHPIQVGYGSWSKETTNLRGQDNEPIAASRAWTAGDTYEVRLCYYHSFFCPLFRFRYMSRQLQIEIEPNVSWTPSAITKITGRVANEAA